jgi:hypothetical protein
MKTYRVRMNYTRAYYVEVEAECHRDAEHYVLANLTHKDCEPDEYAEWEVYSTNVIKETAE